MTENVNTESQDNLESLNNNNETERRVGAKILAIANFDTRHEDIVDSSFNKTRWRSEKLPGKNNERRNYAYLSRLEKLVEKYGNEVEKRLWAASIKDDLLVDYDNIPESYWQSKRQELRDNGLGDIELTEEYKHAIFDKERELQRESLEKWANYLGDEHSPYPLWFKIYAWDGMTKMGRYDKSKGRYATRNKTTVAPYPSPDAEVLSGVFETISRYYGNNEKEFYTEEGERNIELENVVQSGNFARIYDAIEHDITPIIEPPENPEDIHGQWIEYGIGEEDDIARAAKGTGWCVASSSVGRNYLEYGTYAQDDEQEGEWDEELDGNDWGDDDEESYSPKSKFILFHLEDPSAGKLSKNAVASIRLDPSGEVAEISGLKEGQALNDSLVDIVAEKVKTLPGGKRFLDAFTDKQELIRLDRKMQKDEDLTKEELEFIYEIKKQIHTLDTYNEYDPRIKELREKYDIKYALDAGVDAGSFMSKLTSQDIVQNLDTLNEHGAKIDIDELVSRLNGYVVYHLDTLIEHGVKIDDIISRLDSRIIADHLDTLIEHGAKIDIDELVSRLNPYVVYYLDTLIEHGAKIDNIISRLNSYDIIDHLDTLIEHGANIDDIVSWLDPWVFHNPYCRHILEEYGWRGP